jgi:hypothetical protein
METKAERPANRWQTAISCKHRKRGKIFLKQSRSHFFWRREGHCFMWIKWAFVGANILAVVVLGDPPPVKKETDREIFVSARELAVSCQAMKDAVGIDHVLDAATTLSSTRLSHRDIFAVGRCVGYVEGVADEFREATGTHYRPTSAGRGELPVLIDAFFEACGRPPQRSRVGGKHSTA